MEKRNQFSRNKRDAFTRVELAVTLATASLIGATGISVVADGRERSERIVCGNNLRQVGRAFHMWASDHGGQNPWWVRYGDGGSFIANGGGVTDPDPGTFDIPGFGRLSTSFRNNAWFQFIFINQELRTPALLVCPSDRNRTRAQDFSRTPNTGYMAFTVQDLGTSYIVGLHALNQYPSSILSGDRTLRSNGQNASCPVNVGDADTIVAPSSSGWLPFLHNGSGNLLLNDGRVEELSAEGLGSFLNPPGPPDAAPGHHFLKPN